MVKKKSAASKAKTRRDSYRRGLVTLRNSRPWRILLLIMHAVRIFLRSRNDAAIAARLPPSWGVQGDDLIVQNSIGAVCDDVFVIFPNMTDSREQFDDFIVVRQIISKIVSKVCRLDADRKRKAERRHNLSSKEKTKETSLVCQRNWFTNKYRANESFRRANIVKVGSNVLEKYHNDKKFRDHVKERVLKRYHSKYQIRSKIIQQGLDRYRYRSSASERQRKRIYDDSRRILKKYVVMQNRVNVTKCRVLYNKLLKRFRQICKEGPDYICVICRLALFRDQVLLFIEGQYVEKGMIKKDKNLVKSYLPDDYETMIYIT